MQQTELGRGLVRLLWTVVIFLALVGMGAVARRTVVLLRPGATNSARNPAAALDAHFAEHRSLTLIHILPSVLFMVLGPLQFYPRLRRSHPEVHRWSGRVFLTSSGVLGAAGLAMALGPTIGGNDEKAAILLFGTFFLVALAKGLSHALRGEYREHREWMIRGYAIGLAVAAIRPIMGAFFAAAIIQRRAPDPHSFFGIAFWSGFVLAAIAAEAWIHYARARQLVIRPASIAIASSERQ